MRSNDPTESSLEEDRGMPTHLRAHSTVVSVVLFVFAVALLPQVSKAALGGVDTAVAGDAQRLNASMKSENHGAYLVHEISLPSGTTLREYAAVGGTVFAVSWRGPALPDLRQALGKYSDAYLTAARDARQGHGHLEIHHEDLVVQSSGHMRMFIGRAYLTHSLPAGMSLEDIR